MRADEAVMALFSIVAFSVAADAQTTEVEVIKRLCLPSATINQCANPVSPVTIAPGGQVSMLLIVLVSTNQESAANVVATDVLPPELSFSAISFIGPQTNCTTPPQGQTGTIQCNFGTLVSPDSTTCHCPAEGPFVRLELNLTASATPRSTVSNTVTITTTTPETNTANNTNTAVITVGSIIPTLSQYALMALAAVLTAIALRRLPLQ